MTVEKEQEEKRRIVRVQYPANGVIVVCDEQKKIFVSIQDLSDRSRSQKIYRRCPAVSL